MDLPAWDEHGVDDPVERIVILVGHLLYLEHLDAAVDDILHLFKC